MDMQNESYEHLMASERGKQRQRVLKGEGLYI